MSTHLNYHHLYYFKVIATEGSISKAAAKLRLGQPTLSMQLKQFEEVLGQRLFDRRNRSLVLTEMGRVVLTYANEIFHLGEEMMKTLVDQSGQHQQARVAIGALDSVPKSLVRELVKASYRVSDCLVSIREGEGNDLIQDLIEHRLDLVLSNTAPPSLTNETLYSKSVSKSPILVCGAPNFANLGRLFPKSLEGQPIILPTSHSKVRHDFEKFVEDKVLRLKVIAETQDTALMKTLAVDGEGLIIIGAHAVRPQLADGTLVLVGELPGITEETWLIAAQRKIQNPIAKELMKTFIAQ